MAKEELPLPMKQVAGSDKGVSLLTAHGSKGLEFEYVFFAGVNASLGKRNENQEVVTNFRIPCLSSQPKANEEEELRRLFYVALTRAEIHLHISYTI